MKETRDDNETLMKLIKSTQGTNKIKQEVTQQVNTEQREKGITKRLGRLAQYIKSLWNINKYE